MVSHGYRKRGTGVVLLKHVRNPILLAREILVRGETDGGEGDLNGSSRGAQGHCVLGGPTAERLAREWGLEMVAKEYFWTRKRWEEHRRGLGLEVGSEDDMEEIRLKKEAPLERLPAPPHSQVEFEAWDGEEYLPQGTVGCVALDRYGTLCVATSTGGLTNKLSGRIGDTPTLGAGFWAEEWVQPKPVLLGMQLRHQPLLLPPLLATVSEGLRGVLGDCIPTLAGYAAVPAGEDEKKSGSEISRAAAVSGTGNGDSFLRMCACRTASAMARFSPGSRSLASAVTEIAGPGGELQRSAGDRWRRTGEGQGGIIGIELVGGAGKIVFDFNCGGMFRTWVDEKGVARCMVFRDEYP